ncbi:hypothetical protein KP509_32G003200 [Ceratopteris richardii]|uniref:Uncharacterized protein n=1 Tax=Ceratopteris richardii TaxID=49495 RepID=A0A8T2QR75_CERRI|nr:hypothetical protein KP509_32G003200 [Ceratopteris richardii]
MKSLSLTYFFLSLSHTHTLLFLPFVHRQTYLLSLTASICHRQTYLLTCKSRLHRQT